MCIFITVEERKLFKINIHSGIEIFKECWKLFKGMAGITVMSKCEKNLVPHDQAEYTLLETDSWV